jgi:hypothetical protein
LEEEPELPPELEEGEALGVVPQPLASRAASETDKRESSSVLLEFFENIVGHFSFRRLLQAKVSRLRKRAFLLKYVPSRRRSETCTAQQESAEDLILRRNWRCHL